MVDFRVVDISWWNIYRCKTYWGAPFTCALSYPNRFCRFLVEVLLLLGTTTENWAICSYLVISCRLFSKVFPKFFLGFFTLLVLTYMYCLMKSSQKFQIFPRNAIKMWLHTLPVQHLKYMEYRIYCRPVISIPLYIQKYFARSFYFLVLWERKGEAINSMA